MSIHLLFVLLACLRSRDGDWGSEPPQCESNSGHARNTDDGTDHRAEQDEVQPTFHDPCFYCFACIATETTYIA